MSDGKSAAFLTLDKVGKQYQGKSHLVTALVGASLSFAQGEFVTILGPSGCGKTTLLQIIAGIEPASSGRVWLRDKDITDLPPERRHFGVVFQNYALFPNLTVAQNIAYGLHGAEWTRDGKRARVAELLDLTALGDLEKRYPGQLSGGQQQRVALARALAPKPELLLLDEPLSALDAQVRLILGQELRRIQRRTGVTAIMVTHDQEEALALADRIILMNEGKIIQIGTPEELYTSPADRFGAEFIGHMNTVEGVGMRYEDVEVLPPTEQNLSLPHVRVGRVQHTALMGSFYRLDILLNDFATQIYADVTRSTDAELVREGALVAVGLPPERRYHLDDEPPPENPPQESPDKPPPPPRGGKKSWLGLLPLLGGLLFLALCLAYPVLTLLSRSLYSNTGEFVGLGNLLEFMRTPGLASSFFNTMLLGCLTMVCTVIPAFVLSYAVTHTLAKGRRAAAVLSYLPLFVPSLFPAMGLIYLLGNQGPLNFLLGETSLYGPLGILLGGCIYCLPHAVILLTSTLREIDPNLYAAAKTLGAGAARRFASVTLPGARYGLTSAAIVVFLLTITDFGVPKVLGGDYPMLATEVFKQVVGQQNFTMGATISLVLLLPALAAFFLDAWARRGQTVAAKPGRRTLLPSPARDGVLGALSWLVLALPLGVMGMVVWGSFVGFWPYDLEMTWINYSFSESIYGSAPFANSLILAASTALAGTAAIFLAAYALERVHGPGWLGSAYRLLALAPLCIPGTVLGLSYILAFNRRGAVGDFLYGSMTLLVVNSIVHFFAVAHLTASGSLARLDPRFENVGASLGVRKAATFFRVIVPLQKGTLLDMCFYLFINALTTISAVVFLYSPDTVPASVAILQMFDSGQIGEASAMGTLILLAALAARLLFGLFRRIGSAPYS